MVHGASWAARSAIVISAVRLASGNFWGEGDPFAFAPSRLPVAPLPEALRGTEEAQEWAPEPGAADFAPWPPELEARAPGEGSAGPAVWLPPELPERPEAPWPWPLAPERGMLQGTPGEAGGQPAVRGAEEPPPPPRGMAPEDFLKPSEFLPGEDGSADPFKERAWEGLLPGTSKPVAMCAGTDRQLLVCSAERECDVCLPADCRFGDWGPWTDLGGCSGLGQRARDVAVQNNECGKPCQGVREETKVIKEFADAKPLCHVSKDTDCQWAQWSDWSHCGDCLTCEQDRLAQSLRHREVHVRALGNGAPCEGPWNETKPCGEDLPINCEFTKWGDWTECSETCGGGWQARLRRVKVHPRFGGSSCEGPLRETVTCNAQACAGARDCAVSAWSDWQGCRGGLGGQQERTRRVLQYAQGQGSSCNYTLGETAGCVVAGESVCEYGSWSAWSECPASCGGGQQTRSRALTNGGKCKLVQRAALVEVRGCAEEQCAESHCKLSAWSQWSPCSQDCGSGVTERQRQTEGRHGGGGECFAALAEVKECASKSCPKVDCAWGEWEFWSTCSRTCGGGLKRRARSIRQPPREGGLPCMPQDEEEVMPCATGSCDRCVDGVWADWGEWMNCSATCSPAYRSRHRNVKRQSSDCGQPPEGLEDEYEVCQDVKPCTAGEDCLFSEWHSWGRCSGTCTGLKERHRRIARYGSGSGAACAGNLKEFSPCHSGSELEGCVAREPHDCVLGQWDDWGRCSAKCGGGQQIRIRQILQPPTGGGAPCEAALSEMGPCQRQACSGAAQVDCRWGQWSQWSNCTDCGGERYRQRAVEQLPSAEGQPCTEGAGKMVESCPQDACRGQPTAYCMWSEWQDSGECSGSCGAATRLQQRKLSLSAQRPRPDLIMFAGPRDAACSGEQTRMASCGKPACPGECSAVDCLFTGWSMWSEPSCTQLCERSREVYKEARCGGLPCNGTLQETMKCGKDCDEVRPCILGTWEDWSGCQGQTQGTRARAVVQKASNGGEPCVGPLKETRACADQAIVHRVECIFQEWQAWEDCNKLCGGGTSRRARQIGRPASGGGLPCQGMVLEARACGMEKCPQEQALDCIWGQWSLWSACDSNNQRARIRSVRRPPENGGAGCNGALHEVRNCDVAVDCRVSAWTAWDECDKPCDGGQRQRQRQVVRNPLNGGKPCPKGLIETEGCNRMPCPTSSNCKVGDWSGWSSCSATCGPGYKSRFRDIVQRRLNCGLGCRGNLTEVTTCQEQPCGCIDCVWGDWHDWSECTKLCNGGQRYRFRNITRWPRPGCRACDAVHKVFVEPCNTQQCTADHQCVDGTWSPWSDWGACSRSCNGGASWRTRAVRQVPDDCGKEPLGLSHEETTCNAFVPCYPSQDCEFGGWSEWGACTGTCSGVKHRSRAVSRHGYGDGKFCEGALAETVPCAFDGKSPLLDWQNPELYVALAEIQANNLGGAGPRTQQAPVLRYPKVAEDGTRVLDLVLQNATPYFPQDSTMNGIRQAFGNVNVLSGTSVVLDMVFLNQKGGEPVAVADFVLKIIDLDDCTRASTAVTVQSPCMEYYLDSSSPIKVTGGCGKGQTSVEFRKAAVVNPVCQEGGAPTRFDLTNVVHRNLGGFGPDANAMNVRYEKVANIKGQWIDLVVAVAGQQGPRAPSNGTKASDWRAYRTLHPERNGHDRNFGAIDMQYDSSVPFNFSFVQTGTDRPVRLSSFNISFYDLTQPSTTVRERVTVESALAWFPGSDHSTLDVEETAEQVKVSSTRVGSNLPVDPDTVTPEQGEAVAHFYFQAATDVRALLQASPEGQPGGDGRREALGKTFKFSIAACAPLPTNAGTAGQPATSAALPSQPPPLGFDAKPLSASCAATWPSVERQGPAELTPEQEKKAFAVRFQATSKVSIKLAVEGKCCGHNFLFVGKLCTAGLCDPCSTGTGCSFSAWSQWSDCDAECGGGQSLRRRSISLEQTVGKNVSGCAGSVQDMMSCSLKPCPASCTPVDCKWGEWEPWTSCHKCGGQRTRSRDIVVSQACGGRPCETGEAKEMGECPNSCAGDDTYCSWGPWEFTGPCSATCGRGSRTRERKLRASREPPPTFVAKFHEDEELLRQVRALETRRIQGLVVSFACGSLSVMVLLVAQRARRRPRERGAEAPERERWLQ